MVGLQSDERLSDVTYTVEEFQCRCGHAQASHYHGEEDCEECRCAVFRDSAAVSQEIVDASRQVLAVARLSKPTADWSPGEAPVPYLVPAEAIGRLQRSFWEE